MRCNPGITEVGAPELDSAIELPLSNSARSNVDGLWLAIYADDTCAAFARKPERHPATATPEVGDHSARR
jgi:hypothetical protein